MEMNKETICIYDWVITEVGCNGVDGYVPLWSHIPFCEAFKYIFFGT